MLVATIFEIRREDRRRRDRLEQLETRLCGGVLATKQLLPGMVPAEVAD